VQIPLPLVRGGLALGRRDMHRMGAGVFSQRPPNAIRQTTTPAWQVVAARYPMRQTTTPVPVDGGVAAGALPMSA
jgi:hypothetical protein